MKSLVGAMATFKDACFHYQKINELNRRLLSLGVNSSWRPSPLTNCKGWCLDCCQHTDLTYCLGCSLYHVCQWCSQKERCFLDNAPHFTRIRTLKEPVTFEDLDNYVKLMMKLFPINAKLVNKFIKNINQNKCRNEMQDQWYNQLLLPITLSALKIVIGEDIFYVLGLYENTANLNETAFSLVNLVDKYDRLLLDDYNFQRMSFLPVNLQEKYALKYISNSRFLSQSDKVLAFNHFTQESVKDLTVPTSSIYMKRNVTDSTLTIDTTWNATLLLVANVRKFLSDMNSIRYIPFEVSQCNEIFLKRKFVELGSIVAPGYIASNHLKKASRITKCKWCTAHPNTILSDYRMKMIYDVIMEFLRVLVKSNVNVGHCSSVETIFKSIPCLFNPLDNKKFSAALEKFFIYLDPQLVQGVYYVLMDHMLSPQLVSFILKSGKHFSTILTKHDIKCLILNVFNAWFDLPSLQTIPFTLYQTSALLKLKNDDKLENEFTLEISDDED
uniref:Non-structural protein 1 n=1 Tax=Rotavirus A TaxID=28875 RepID=A0A8D6C2H9_9REOV|nr:non-structural protein 1 [Rotavirus A]